MKYSTQKIEPTKKELLEQYHTQLKSKSNLLLSTNQLNQDSKPDAEEPKPNKLRAMSDSKVDQSVDYSFPAYKHKKQEPKT